MPSPRLIHFVDVAMSYPREGLLPQIVLVPGTISLPTDRRLAVLVRRHQGKTTLLQLLSGKLRPDQGEVIGADSLSPVVNAGGLLHPQLSAVENIRFLARAYGFDPDVMLMAVDALQPVDFPLNQPLKGRDGGQRRSLEAAVVFLLPFQCYLVDEIGQLDTDLVGRCMDSLADRQAGIVFTTSQSRLASQYADAAVLIDDGLLHLFQDVEEAVEVYEAKRRV